MKNIHNIFVDLKVRTSKIENIIFQIILEKIQENIETLEKKCSNELKIEFSLKKFSIEEIQLGIKGLMNKGVDIIYYKEEIKNELSFNYITSYRREFNVFFISIPFNIINCFKKNTFEYSISLRTFFYLRKNLILIFLIF